jgi:hypothetical protein
MEVFPASFRLGQRVDQRRRAAGPFGIYQRMACQMAMGDGFSAEKLGFRVTVEPAEPDPLDPLPASG